MSAPVPGLVLAGSHSGCGKTTLCAGLIRALAARGRAVAPFKTGPDFLDPQLLRAAAGRPCWNLDGWFMDDDELADAYARGSAGAALALAEGAMGLYDGADPVSFRGSSADLARRLGLPVVLALDASGMAGILSGQAVMTEALQRFGYRELETRVDTLLAPAGSRARGHEFHCSRWEGGGSPAAYRSTPLQGPTAEEGFVRGRLLASYAHVHFASAPGWAEHWAAVMAGSANGR